MSGSLYVPILYEEKSLFVPEESLLYAKLLNKCGMV